MRTTLQGLDDSSILRCFDLTLWFGTRYAAACELPGPIHLVLDNSLIQAFKHRQTNAKRAIDALAFENFCVFVRDWSDRESHLALSPMAVFEHIGRRLPDSAAEVERILADLWQLLAATGLRIVPLGHPGYAALSHRCASSRPHPVVARPCREHGLRRSARSLPRPLLVADA